MLLLLDLDNTLVDRDGAFERWTRDLVDQVDGDADDLAWLLDLDDHGYAPRVDLADGLRDRLRLPSPREALVHDLLRGHLPFIRCYDGVLDALSDRRAAGDELVILTNGTVDQQSRKLHHAGLTEVVDRVVISEAVGAKKPDPEIFRVAMDGAATAWMIGDHAINDIGGGRRAGCLTGWVSQGTAWPGGTPPTVSAPTTRDVLAQVAAYDA